MPHVLVQLLHRLHHLAPNRTVSLWDVLVLAVGLLLLCWNWTIIILVAALTDHGFSLVAFFSQFSFPITPFCSSENGSAEPGGVVTSRAGHLAPAND